MNRLFKRIIGLTLGLSMAVGVGVGIANNNKTNPIYATAISGTKVTSYSNIVSGTDYYIGATTSSTDYLLSVPDDTATGVSGTAVTDMDNATPFTFTGSGTSWKIQFANGNYLSLASTKANGKVNVQEDEDTFTASNVSSKIRLSIGSYSIQKNNSGTQFGSYGNTQTDVWLLEVPAPKTLSSISVYDNSGKSWYAGDVVTPSDLRIVATYSDSTSNTITDGTGVTITSGATLSQGNNTVNVTYTDSHGTASGSVSISAAATVSLSSIAITTAPTKVVYNEYDVFDPTGMVVTATYSDFSTSNVVSSCTYSPSGALTVENDEITISYTYKGVTKTATQSITVNPVNEVTFTAGTDLGTTTSNNSADSMSKNGFTVSGTDAAFAAVSSGTYTYRVYSGSQLTFSVAAGDIGKITIVKNGSYALSLLSLKAGEQGSWNSTTGVWTGKADSVTFTASAQFRADSFTIEKASTAPSISLDINALSFKTNDNSEKPVVVTVINVDNPVFNWDYDDTLISITEVSNANGVQTVNFMRESIVAAETTATVSITGTALTASVTVSITVPEPGETAETAFTIAQAISHIDDVILDGTTTGNDGNNYYATGIISRFYSNSVNNNGQISYYISADGTTSGAELEAYNGKGLNGAAFNSIDDIRVGDTVIIFGQLKKHSSTYEFEANNYIVSLTPAPRVNSIALTPSSVTVETLDTGNVADLFTNIVINQDEGSNKGLNDISWSSDDDDVLYLDDGQYLAGDQHRSSTTIRASIDGREYGSATVVIIDPSIYSISYEIEEEWVLVTNPSTLAAGDRVILTGVKNDVAYAAGTYSSGNNVPADTEHPLSVSENKVTGVVSTMIYTLEEGSVTGSLAFKDSANKYLYAAGASSNNYMKTQESINNNASFMLNSDGTVVAQGTGSRCYMRYNNYSASNLFSCYAVDASTDTNVTFYKLVGGAGVLDLQSASSYAKLQARETGEGVNLVVDQVSMTLGLRISESDWNQVDSVLGISEYGIMLFRTDNISSVLSVKEYYELGEENVTISRRDAAGISPTEGFYDFSVKININNPANFDRYYCAAPFIVAGGNCYFFNEVDASINDLADNYSDDDLSIEALLYLATTNN